MDHRIIQLEGSRIGHQMDNLRGNNSESSHQMAPGNNGPTIDQQMEQAGCLGRTGLNNLANEAQHLSHINGNQAGQLEHHVNHVNGHVNHVEGHMDHVDGHTLSSVPLSVGCPDPSLLSNIFQDTVSEAFIDFGENTSQPSFLTTVSSVFASNVFSVSSPQMPSSIASPQFSGSSSYPILRTPVYSSSADNQVFPTTIQEPLVFSWDSKLQTPVYGLDVQELDCINLNQIKTSDLDLPPINTVQESRLTVLSGTWTGDLSAYLSTGVWGDLTIRAFNPSSDFQTVCCHKLVVGAVSPVIKAWLADIIGEDDDPCIILPDFSSDEVDDFLSVVYLSSHQSTNNFNQILRCLNGVDSPRKVENQLKNEAKSGQPNETEQSGGNSLKPEEERLLLKGETEPASTRRRASKVEVKLEQLDQQLEDKLPSSSVTSSKRTKVKKPSPPSVPPPPPSAEQKAEEVGDAKPAADGRSSPAAPPPAKVPPTARAKASAAKPKGPFPCAKCGKQFKVWRILKEHENLHSEPKFECSFEGCAKKFHTKSNLKAHVDVVHHKKKDLPCEVCGKLFYNASLLKVHSETHNPEKYYCSHCPASFASSKNLRIHIRTKHTSDENVPKCYICHKTLASDMVLRQHIARVHFNEKNFVCVHCGKAFYEKTELKLHLAIHSNIGAHIPCQMCDSKFKKEKYLRSHVKNVHGNLEKKHVCHLCGKSFSNGYKLNRHMEGHRQKTVACPTCNKTFASEQRVVEHARKVHKQWRKNKTNHHRPPADPGGHLLSQGEMATLAPPPPSLVSNLPPPPPPSLTSSLGQHHAPSGELAADHDKQQQQHDHHHPDLLGHLTESLTARLGGHSPGGLLGPPPPSVPSPPVGDAGLLGPAAPSPCEGGLLGPPPSPSDEGLMPFTTKLIDPQSNTVLLIDQIQIQCLGPNQKIKQK